MVWINDEGKVQLCETGIDGFLIAPVIKPCHSTISGFLIDEGKKTKWVDTALAEVAVILV